MTGPVTLDAAAVEAVLAPAEDGIRMDAYYYGFDRTGVGVVDRILSAVAQAGKAFHHTESWSDEMDFEYGLINEGETCAEAIQRLANEAAAAIVAALTKAAHQ